MVQDGQIVLIRFPQTDQTPASYGPLLSSDDYPAAMKIG